MLPLSDLVTSLYCLNSFTRQTSAFSQTGSFIFPTWNLLLAVFDLPPFHIIRKLSLNVLKFSFHIDHTILTTMKLIYVKHQTKILGILNLNILLPLLHPRLMVVLVGERIAIICTFLVPGYQGVFTCIISFNCDK